MSERVPTPQQRKLIKMWLYAPVPAITLPFMVGQLMQLKWANSFAFTFLAGITLIVLGIARKVETSRRMVLPAREEKNFLIFFAVFFVSSKVGAALFLGHSDWTVDLIGYSFAFLAITPFFLFFRKIKPQVQDGVPFPSPE